MCGCSNFVNNDERDIITQDELSREFDFTGNRPSIIEVGEDPSFDFTGDLDGNTQFDDFIGKKAKARRQERRAKKQGQDTTTTTQTTRSTEDNSEKSTYGGGWFGRNWHLLLIGAVVVGGGIYVYKKRK